MSSDADYLLESSIRAESGRLRITAKLIRVRDQVQVWSQTYNREPTSMLGLQQELSAGIAEQIRFRLSPERSARWHDANRRNAAAYDLYLRGLNFANRRTPATTQTGDRALPACHRSSIRTTRSPGQRSRMPMPRARSTAMSPRSR